MACLEEKLTQVFIIRHCESLTLMLSDDVAPEDVLLSSSIGIDWVSKLTKLLLTYSAPLLYILYEHRDITLPLLPLIKGVCSLQRSHDCIRVGCLNCFLVKLASLDKTIYYVPL